MILYSYKYLAKNESDWGKKLYDSFQTEMYKYLAGRVMVRNVLLRII